MYFAEDLNVDLMHQGDQEVEQYTNTNRVTSAIVTHKSEAVSQHPFISSSTCVTNSNSTSTNGLNCCHSLCYMKLFIPYWIVKSKVCILKSHCVLMSCHW